MQGKHNLMFLCTLMCINSVFISVTHTGYHGRSTGDPGLFPVKCAEVFLVAPPVR